MKNEVAVKKMTKAEIKAEVERFAMPYTFAAKRKPSLTVNDLLVLAAAGQAVLNTNKALKTGKRRMLRTAVNRTMKYVESL